MTERPTSITLISWTFVAFGGIALLTGLTGLADPAAAERIAQHPGEFWLTQAIRILAVVSGVFMLYGFSWARWLLVVWAGYHVVLGAVHSPFQFIAHSLLFGVIVYFVSRPRASAFFRGTRRERRDLPGSAL